MSIANEKVERTDYGRGDVWNDVMQMYMTTLPVNSDLLNLMQERRDFGIAKYNRPLMYDNGENALQDCIQENLDIMAYFYKHIIETGNITKHASNIMIMLYKMLEYFWDEYNQYATKETTKEKEL